MKVETPLVELQALLVHHWGCLIAHGHTDSRRFRGKLETQALLVQRIQIPMGGVLM